MNTSPLVRGYAFVLVSIKITSSSLFASNFPMIFKYSFVFLFEIKQSLLRKLCLHVSTFPFPIFHFYPHQLKELSLPGSSTISPSTNPSTFISFFIRYHYTEIVLFYPYNTLFLSVQYTVICPQPCTSKNAASVSLTSLQQTPLITTSFSSTILD